MILRKGMWVTHKGKTCILIPERGALTLHVVDAKGETVAVLDSIKSGDFTPAAYNDIPEPRRPDKATAKRLGYL